MSSTVQERTASRFLGRLRRQGFLLLDGGLATTLEELGQDLDDDLWSARVILDGPEVVCEAHRRFVEAGADCIATVTYQATFEGLARRGIDAEQARELFELAVRLARDAAAPGTAEGRAEPALVAGSIGPYGAYLADGSEYRGAYGLSCAELVRFHRDRFALLAASDCDLLAFETIPDRQEVEALLTLLEETAEVEAWLSLSLRDGERLADGTSLVELLDALPGRYPAGWSRLVAVGANCAPASRFDRALDLLLERVGPESLHRKEIVLYPNSGETWSAETHEWRGSGEDWLEHAVEWHRRGARVLGGCCRTTPDQIADLRRRLSRTEVRPRR